MLGVSDGFFNNLKAELKSSVQGILSTSQIVIPGQAKIVQQSSAFGLLSGSGK